MLQSPETPTGGLYVEARGPEGPSPWWLKGGAIFIGVLGFASLVNAIVLGVSGLFMEELVSNLDIEGACENDPDPEACEELLQPILDMAELRIFDLGTAASALLFLLSIPTVVVMWSAEDRETALRFAWGWLGIHAASQFYFTHVLVSWSNQFYEQIPDDEFDMSLISAFNSLASYGSVLFCELTMAAGLALVAYQSKPASRIEVPSAFHHETE